ncbi:MAG: hypothetical protein U5K29_05895 [Acidimicrobiales bacterium]|nr:hypothetical protein [Acidimicrobiales bacterium]
MVAISTDSPRWLEPHHREATVIDPPPLRLASGGERVEPVNAVSRLLAVMAVVALAVVVAAGTITLGRVLDSQRGIPASASVAAEADPSSPVGG